MFAAFCLIMAAIVNSALAGFTVTYNTVQFGGSDATYSSVPPTYSLAGEFAYDDSRRAIIGVRYRLAVATLFYANTEADLADNMEAVREKLSQPARELKIDGLGTGFGTINSDIDNGPRPLGIECNPIGNLCWECVWTVEFMVSECESGNPNPLAWMAFNFDATWQNDFEGITERTISGYVQIALRRTAAAPKIVAHVADEARDQLGIICPDGFRRASNVWRESQDRGRLDFVIVDQQLPGDVLPEGITLASGSDGLDFGAAPAFSTATNSISASYKVAPDRPRNLAGIVFLTTVIAKTAKLNAGGVVAMPATLRMTNRKYDEARVTECSASWVVTKCINAIMAAADIWAPLTANNYNLWRASVEPLWNNRGTAQLRSLASEAVIIDLCDNVSQGVIGNTPANILAVVGPGLPTLACPNIPEDGGWIMHDLRVRIYREDRQTWHKLAKEYLPPAGSIGQTGDTLAESISIGGPDYTQSESEKDIAEYHGFPDVLVGVQFRALRVKRKPPFPELKSVGGINARLINQDVLAPTLAFDMLTCPVWYTAGWRLYRVSGYVPTVKATGSPASCAAPDVPQDF